jgi:hypothetical protein
MMHEEHLERNGLATLTLDEDRRPQDEDPTGLRSRFKLQSQSQFPELVPKRENRHRRMSSLNLIAKKGLQSGKISTERVKEHLPLDFLRKQANISQANYQLDRLRGVDTGKHQPAQKSLPQVQTSNFSVMPDSLAGMRHRQVKPHLANGSTHQRTGSRLTLTKGFKQQLHDSFNRRRSQQDAGGLEQKEATMHANQLRLEMLGTVVKLLDAFTPVDCLLKYQALHIEEMRQKLSARPELSSRALGEDLSDLSSPSKETIALHLDEMVVSSRGAEANEYQKALQSLYSLIGQTEDAEKENAALHLRLSKLQKDKLKVQLIETLHEERLNLQNLEKTIGLSNKTIDKEINLRLEEAHQLRSQLSSLQSTVESSISNSLLQSSPAKKYSFAKLGSKLKQPTLSSTHLPISEETGPQSIHGGNKLSNGSLMNQDALYMLNPHQEHNRGAFLDIGASTILIRKRNAQGSLFSSIPFTSNKDNGLNIDVARSENQVKTPRNHLSPFIFPDQMSQREPKRNRSLFADNLSQTVNQDSYEDLRSKVELNGPQKQDIDTTSHKKPVSSKGPQISPCHGPPNSRLSLRTKTFEKTLSLREVLRIPDSELDTPQQRKKAIGNNPTVIRRGPGSLDHRPSIEKIHNKFPQNNSIEPSVALDCEVTSIRLPPDGAQTTSQNLNDKHESNGSQRGWDLTKPPKPTELDKIEESVNEDNETNIKKKSSKKCSAGNGQKASSGTEALSAINTNEEGLKKLNSIRKKANSNEEKRNPLLGSLEETPHKIKPINQRFSVKHPTTNHLPYPIILTKSNSFTDFGIPKIKKSRDKLSPKAEQLMKSLIPYRKLNQGVLDPLGSEDSHFTNQTKLLNSIKKKSSGSSIPKQEVSQIKEEDASDDKSSSVSHPSSQELPQSNSEPKPNDKIADQKPKRKRKESIVLADGAGQLTGLPNIPSSIARSRQDTSLFQAYPYHTPQEELILTRVSVGSQSNDPSSEEKTSNM